MRKPTALFICESGVHTMALARQMSAAGWDCDVHTVRGSYLSKLKQLRTITFAPPGADFLKNVTVHHDLVVYGQDSYLRAVTPEKLPVSTVDGRLLLDSKIGFVELSNRLGLKIPISAIIQNESDLEEAKRSVPFPAFLKGDHGAGGGSVLRIESADSAIPTTPLYLPGILQQEIKSERIGVDAIFNHGELVAWLYSTDQQFISEFGPSFQRTYINPPNLDFLDDLRAMGEASGFHGFANCSFVLNAQDGRHYFFEFDLRPNHWHRCFIQFGIDPGEVLRDGWCGGCLTPKLPVGGVRSFNYLRALVYFAESRQLFNFVKSIARYRLSSDGVTGERSFYIITRMGIGIYFLHSIPQWIANPLRQLRKKIKSLRQYI